MNVCFTVYSQSKSKRSHSIRFIPESVPSRFVCILYVNVYYISLFPQQMCSRHINAVENSTISWNISPEISLSHFGVRATCSHPTRSKTLRVDRNKMIIACPCLCILLISLLNERRGLLFIHLHNKCVSICTVYWAGQKGPTRTEKNALILIVSHSQCVCIFRLNQSIHPICQRHNIIFKIDINQSVAWE